MGTVGEDGGDRAVAKGQAIVRDRAVRGSGSEYCPPHRPWATLEARAGRGANSGGVFGGSQDDGSLGLLLGGGGRH